MRCQHLAVLLVPAVHELAVGLCWLLRLVEHTSGLPTAATFTGKEVVVAQA